MVDSNREDIILMLASKEVEESSVYSILYLLQFTGIDLGFRYSITQRGITSKQAMQVIDQMESSGIVELDGTLRLTRLGADKFMDLVVTYDIFSKFKNCMSAINELNSEGLELLVLAQMLFENELKTTKMIKSKQNKNIIKDAIEKFKCKEYDDSIFELLFATLLKIKVR